MNDHHVAKFFTLNNVAIEADLREVQEKFSVDLGPSHRSAHSTEKDNSYYPQFAAQLRAEAERMAANYTIFYSLENSIRTLIDEVLTEKTGENWWDRAGVVPEPVKKNAEENRKREQKTGFTPRSDSILNYTNFGELGEIIKSNWDFFDDILRDKIAVGRIFAALNTLRAPIAHCSPLAEDEELRLHLSMRDWFRQQS